MTRGQNAKNRHIFVRTLPVPGNPNSPLSAIKRTPSEDDAGDALQPEELEALFPFLKPLRNPEWPSSPSVLASARSVTDFEDSLASEGENGEDDGESFDGDDETWKWGLGLLLLSGFVFIFCFYAAFVSSFVEPTGIEFLDWISEDRYYSYLVPLTLPVAVVLMMINWVGFKIFKHNL
jgi:phosphatidylinositol glycan anchor class Y biosynthesis protein